MSVTFTPTVSGGSEIIRLAKGRCVDILTHDFADYLKDYTLEVQTDTTEYGKYFQVAVILTCADGRIYRCVSDRLQNLYSELWRTIARAWLTDPEADKGPPRKTTTHQKNPWTRTDRHQPCELSEKEEAIRFKLAFGLKE